MGATVKWLLNFFRPTFRYVQLSGRQVVYRVLVCGRHFPSVHFVCNVGMGRGRRANHRAANSVRPAEAWAKRSSQDILSDTRYECQQQNNGRYRSLMHNPFGMREL
jgi:hypothetical protein